MTLAFDLAASLDFVWACRAAGLHGEAIRRVRAECRRGVPVKEAVEREVKAQAEVVAKCGSVIYVHGAMAAQEDLNRQVAGLFGGGDQRDLRDARVSDDLRSVINRGLRRLARFGD